MSHLLLIIQTLFLCVSSSPYNQSTAIHHLLFAYGAYCPKSQLKSWTCKWCYNHSDFLLHSVQETEYFKWNLKVFTGYDPTHQQIVISFSGLSNTKNWIDDLTYLQKPYPGVEGGNVHVGYYDVWQQLRKRVKTDLAALLSINPGNKILFTGHSLGGALAQIAAIDFAISSTADVIVYTYGSPRWCNKILADYYATKISLNWRLVNRNDIVATLPPKEQVVGVISPYHHTGTEIHYTSHYPLEYTQCNGSGEDPKCDCLFPSLHDHSWYLDIYQSCNINDKKKHDTSNMARYKFIGFVIAICVIIAKLCPTKKFCDMLQSQKMGKKL